MKRLLFAFIAGFVAVLIFHQGMLSILYAVGFTSRAPFPIQPTQPLAIPQIWSSAFWGGVWGLVFAAFFRLPSKGARYWLGAILFGAIGPTLAAWFLVASIKGQPLAVGWKLAPMMTGFLVNGAWGLGTALFLHWFSRK
ncbi:MAG: hypothetical protein KKH04_20200 [Proteobacteria bacterium]|nr:hypothetical protein [Pseudomonadota bacterium]